MPIPPRNLPTSKKTSSTRPETKLRTKSTSSNATAAEFSKINSAECERENFWNTSWEIQNKPSGPNLASEPGDSSAITTVTNQNLNDVSNDFNSQGISAILAAVENKIAAISLPLKSNEKNAYEYADSIISQINDKLALLDMTITAISKSLNRETIGKEQSQIDDLVSKINVIFDAKIDDQFARLNKNIENLTESLISDMLINNKNKIIDISAMVSDIINEQLAFNYRVSTKKSRLFQNF
jgi:hypothetical protein